MGYRTCYSIEVITGETRLIQELRECCSDAEDAFDETGWSTNETRWDSYRDDMKSFSEYYPDVIFCIEGRGDDPDDFWRTYFKNGKMQHIEQISYFPDYDLEKFE